MIPCCQKCGKELVYKNKEWVAQCRCKLEKTPKTPKNLLNRHQQRKINEKYFHAKKIGWSLRPIWAKII